MGREQKLSIIKVTWKAVVGDRNLQNPLRKDTMLYFINQSKPTVLFQGPKKEGVVSQLLLFLHELMQYLTDYEFHPSDL